MKKVFRGLVVFCLVLSGVTGLFSSVVPAAGTPDSRAAGNPAGLPGTGADTAGTYALETARPPVQKAVISGGVQKVVIDLEPGWYTPIMVQKGIPVEWTIRAARGKLTGCNRSLVIPDLDLEQVLKIGDTLIKFLPKTRGEIAFSCWMGMINSTIFVVDDLAKAPIPK